MPCSLHSIAVATSTIDTASCCQPGQNKSGDETRAHSIFSTEALYNIAFQLKVVRFHRTDGHPYTIHTMAIRPFGKIVYSGTKSKCDFTCTVSPESPHNHAIKMRHARTRIDVVHVMLRFCFMQSISYNLLWQLKSGYYLSYNKSMFLCVSPFLSLLFAPTQSWQPSGARDGRAHTAKLHYV